MPNTKSAERRVRSNARKHTRNTSVKSRLKTLERRLNDAVKEGKQETVKAALINVTSAFDKAAKSGTIHKSTADRKKSRLSLRANTVK